jgi:hypothetical protein
MRWRSGRIVGYSYRVAKSNPENAPRRVALRIIVYCSTR